MNQNGVIYFTPDSNNTTENNCGAIILTGTNLKKQETYSERHKNDFANKALLIRILDTFKPAIIMCTIILIIFNFIIMNGFIPSESMAPTLNIGDGIVVNRLAYAFNEPERGDVVVFVSDEYSGEYLIKRVVGLPGDIIDIKDGSVYVNGCKLVEEYAHGETLPSLSQVTHYEVPENSVFLLGDNRENSADSRWWVDPYINYDEIIGKATFQYSLNATTGMFAKGIVSKEPSFINN